MRILVALSAVSIALAVPMSDEEREIYENKIYQCTNHNPNICTREFKWYESTYRTDYLWRCPPLDKNSHCTARWRTICKLDTEGRCWCKKLLPENRVNCPEGCKQTQENFAYCHCPDLPDCVDSGIFGFFRKNCGYMKGKCYCEANCHTHHSMGAIDNHFNGSD